MLRWVKKLFYDPAYQKKKAFLRSLDLFKDLRGREFAHLIQVLHNRVYHEGEQIFVEGDIGRALFILETGKVELTQKDPSGRPRVIYTLKPGDFFGEMALLEQLPRSASATAVERSHLFLLYRSKLDTILHSYPRVGVSIMGHLAQILSARLRRATAAKPEAAATLRG